MDSAEPFLPLNVFYSFALSLPLTSTLVIPASDSVLAVSTALGSCSIQFYLSFTSQAAFWVSSAPS